MMATQQFRPHLLWEKGSKTNLLPATPAKVINRPHLL